MSSVGKAFQVPAVLFNLAHSLTFVYFLGHHNFVKRKVDKTKSVDLISDIKCEAASSDASLVKIDVR